MPGRIPVVSGPRLRGRRIKDVGEKDRAAFYGSKEWRALRLAFLRENPLCAPCSALGQVTAANTVHHKIDRLKARSLELEWDNLEASCSACHTAHHKRKGTHRI